MAAYEIGITDINTQVRRLGYASAILLILGSKTLSEQLLFDRLEKWSVKHESDLTTYVNRQGQIKATRGKSSAKNYTEFTSSLGLIARIAGAYRVTRFGKVLLHFLLTETKHNPFTLSFSERFQYLYWLSVKDGDRLMTVVNLIATRGKSTLKDLQDHFQRAYVEFLGLRIGTEDERSAREILALRNSVSNDWKNPRRYAESIVPPRINWLADLGLANIPASHHSLVSLTQSGYDLLDRLPRLPNSELRYVTQSWIRKEFFSSAGQALTAQRGERWKNAEVEEKVTRLVKLLTKAFTVLRGSPAPKVSLLPVLLFTAVSLANEGIWIELDELREQLQTMESSGLIPFDVRFSHRENESYLISRLS